MTPIRNERPCLFCFGNVPAWRSGRDEITVWGGMVTMKRAACGVGERESYYPKVIGMMVVSLKTAEEISFGDKVSEEADENWRPGVKHSERPATHP